MAKKQTPPDTSASAPVVDVQAESTPAIENVSSETVSPDPDIPAEPAPLFDATSLPEPAALPVGGEFPEPEPHQEKRGRKKIYATPEEAKEAKRQRDRARRAGGTVSASVPSGVPVANNASAKLGAQTIVFSLDTARAIISSGECRADAAMRDQLLMVWEQYLLETGQQPPAWIMVTIMSLGYVAPAFDTPTAQSRLTKISNTVKAWWVKKFGG